MTDDNNAAEIHLPQTKGRASRTGSGHKKKLAILTTHPIQYHAKWFQSLAEHPEVDLEVMFCHRATATEQAQAGFGVEFDWDVSLLDGYRHRFLQNTAAQPGIGTFRGLDTPEVAEIIGRKRFDAVMVNGWHYKSAWQTMRACWGTQTPVMVRSDSHLHTDRSLAKRVLKRPFYSWFINKLDACLPVGRWSSDYFLHYGAVQERVITVPHVIDTKYFRQESERLRPQCDALRANWRLSSNAVVILFAGKFIEKKRPLDFVNAIAQAKAQGAEVEGLMVGDGPLRPACEDLVGKNNLPIKFAGFLNQSEIARAYTVADALVLPSDGGETWGLVVNEAMACGVPCFVSDHVGCGPDMINASETGAVFPLGDIGALAGVITEFASNKPLRSWMRERAGDQAQKYTVRVAVDCTVNALKAVSR